MNWYRIDRGTGWSKPHLFALGVPADVRRLDMPARMAPPALCGWGVRPEGRVLFAPALPRDPKCSRCERLA